MQGLFQERKQKQLRRSRKWRRKNWQNRTCTDKEIRLGGLPGFGSVKPQDFAYLSA